MLSWFGFLERGTVIDLDGVEGLFSLKIADLLPRIWGCISCGFAIDEFSGVLL